MAGRKEKPVLIACQATSGRITRSQAAANRTRSVSAPSVPLPLKTKQKHAAKGNMKRKASDENASVDAGASAPQPKRRTVLKNVTNISCANASKKCTAVTKLKSGPSQKVGQSINKQCANKIPKLLPLAVGGSSFVNDSNSAEETQKVDLLAQKKKHIVLLENKGALSLQNIEQNRDNACHEVFFEERNARNKLETAALKAGHSDGLNIIDIDKNNGDPQMCVTYVAEIYRNLMASELIRRPRPNYMETLQQDITKSMRGLLIDWLVEVTEEYKLVADTLYLTVYLIDQFLSHNCIQMQKLQLLGITSMLIASKYEEFCAPSIEEFCIITDNTYQKDEVLEMERTVLNGLGFYLSVPTTNTFLRRFLRAAQASYIAPLTTLCYLANYLAELTLIDYDFLKFLPSVVAASSVFLARWTLNQSDHPWSPTLEHYTSYKSSNIQMCVCALQELQRNTSNCPLKSIREKYGQQKAPDTTLGHAADYLTELTLVDYGFLEFLPSVMAASAVFLARWTLHQSDHPWLRTVPLSTTPLTEASIFGFVCSRYRNCSAVPVTLTSRPFVTSTRNQRCAVRLSAAGRAYGRACTKSAL
ncbi:Cyclin-A2-1 [Dichanthelium oligosanthes]|uniref:Cyclin-A2-1 n=1 Tax=Dichanthelium oligosanthes TaxID=888268 RepID=A0A1E5UN02_9POAL|nr:Cyclin-A2-1 [Dichanthelium oligosanthes]